MRMKGSLGRRRLPGPGEGCAVSIVTASASPSMTRSGLTRQGLTAPATRPATQAGLLVTWGQTAPRDGLSGLHDSLRGFATT
jgi:hypothetical protein